MKQEHIDYLLSCDGWCSEQKMKRLFALVQQAAVEFNDASLLSVELGVFAGRSFYPMALAHQQLERGYALGIDAWNNEAPLEGTNTKTNNDWWAQVPIKEIYNRFLQTGKFLQVGNYARHRTGKTEDFVNRFADESITLLHQDSNHNIETISRELRLYAPKIKPGGYWVADDTDWKEAKDGYALLPLHGFELLEDYETWQIWKKKL